MHFRKYTGTFPSRVSHTCRPTLSLPPSPPHVLGRIILMFTFQGCRAKWRIWGTVTRGILEVPVGPFPPRASRVH